MANRLTPEASRFVLRFYRANALKVDDHGAVFVRLPLPPGDEVWIYAGLAHVIEEASAIVARREVARHA